MSKQEYKRICHIYRHWIWAIGMALDAEKRQEAYNALVTLPQAHIRIAEKAYNWWQNRDLFICYAACTPQYWGAQMQHKVKPDYSRYR